MVVVKGSLFPCLSNVPYRERGLETSRIAGEILASHNDQYQEGWLSCGLLRGVIRYILTDLSESFTSPSPLNSSETSGTAQHPRRQPSSLMCY
jgi:hypothetical protein